MSDRILNIDDIQYMDLGDMSQQLGETLPEGFGGCMGMVGNPLGAQKLGCNVTIIAPGKRAFPFHSHRAKEELFFILEGQGELRYGKDTHPVRGGDFIACPPGGPDTAHQFVNTGTKELKFLAISTTEMPDICEYPDSGKFAVQTGFGEGDFQHVGRSADSLEYWEGE